MAERSSTVEDPIVRNVENYDHHDPELPPHVFEVWDRLRKECPVAHSGQHGGFWAVTGYRELGEAARDDATFRSAFGITVPGTIPLPDVDDPADLATTGNLGPPGVGAPIMTDPPLILQYRKMLNPFFTPAAATRAESYIRASATRLIDGFIERGSCDVEPEFAMPLVARFTLWLCGFPEEEWATFQAQSNENRARTDAPEIPEHSYQERRHRDEILSIAAERRKEPKHDLISHLVHSEVDGRALTDEEIVGILGIVISGGVGTTRDLIGCTVLHLGRNPDVRQQLLDDPSRIPTAVEEFVRVFPPITGLARVASRDCALGGQSIRRGDPVLLLWGAANRDEREFPRADEVVIDRNPNRHVGFGVGVHRCIGSHFARAEVRIALEEILRRLPDYTVDEDRVTRHGTVSMNYGFSSVPLRFTPGVRSDAS
jgi:cytochrome P450